MWVWEVVLIELRQQVNVNILKGFPILLQHVNWALVLLSPLWYQILIYSVNNQYVCICTYLYLDVYTAVHLTSVSKNISFNIMMWLWQTPAGGKITADILKVR